MDVFKLNEYNNKIVDDKIIITNHHFNRFISFVNIKNIDECWEWTGTIDKYGYGNFSMNHKLFKAHRISYVLHHNNYNKNLVCCHTCDNPKCVNPKHLWLGTQLDNIKDRQNKKEQKQVIY